MATLILSTVGTLGGALGSLVGQSIDQQLFGPPARHGPRLGDLSIQTSSYGTPIPRIYGTMRVAGSVVWATDLKEEENVQGGGKSGPEVVTYAYSASFAVALSSRRAVRIGRIWADGKLLRGAEGDFKVACTVRFHPGSEDQPVDPLIASIEGSANTPAFRGLALAVFEDLALVDYGNRIPMLTFELVADEAAVTVPEILSDVSRGLIAGSTDVAAILGYAAHGADRRAAIEDLVSLWGLELRDEQGRLAIIDAGAAVSVASARDRGCEAEGSHDQREDRSQQPARALPASLTLNYYEPGRDYQAGQMRALIAGGGRARWRVDCPAVLGASEAKRLANQAMARRWAERDRMTLMLAPSFLALRPGELVEVAGVSSRWKVEAVTLDRLVVVAVLRRTTIAGPVIAADPGRGVSEPDLIVGETDLALFDFPDPAFGIADAMTVLVVGSTMGGFRPVPVAVSVSQQPYSSVTLTRRAILGRATTALPAAPSALIDSGSTVEVALTSSSQYLLNTDDDALAIGANLAVVGNELIQFGRAEPIAPDRWRLSRLLRGRRGTEWATGGHAAGERFWLVDRAAMALVALDPGMRGASIAAAAYGIADNRQAPPSASLVVQGEALRPLAPAHLAADATDGGGLEVSWVPRSRAGFAWVDGVGDPSLDGRNFEVSLSGAGGQWTVTTSASSLVVGGSIVAATGPGEIAVAVAELASSARSRAAETTVTIN